jgi:hypothetical protein
LRLFENDLPRRIFGTKRVEETGWWRKLHNEKLHNFYSLSNIIMAIKSSWKELVGHIASMGEIIDAYKMLVGEPKCKKCPEWFRRY